MRIIEDSQVLEALSSAIQKITYHCDPRITEQIGRALEQDPDEYARDVYQAILQNHQISATDQIPLCQDTGSTVIFAELGNEVLICGNTLQEIADQAAAQAAQSCPLRASIVSDPLFKRINSTNNSPAILHIQQVRGDRLKLCVTQKGGGAENMSFLTMFTPATPLEDIRESIIQSIIDTGSRACPPLVIGIGIGGNFERCAILAKRALLEELGRANPIAEYADLERDILQGLNSRGCGAQGMGGILTAIAVHILQEPCHIASLPIAVNIQCHVHRHIEVEL